MWVNSIAEVACLLECFEVDGEELNGYWKDIFVFDFHGNESFTWRKVDNGFSIDRPCPTYQPNNMLVFGEEAQGDQTGRFIQPKSHPSNLAITKGQFHVWLAFVGVGRRRDGAI